jgi:hypothetical protein
MVLHKAAVITRLKRRISLSSNSTDTLAAFFARFGMPVLTRSPAEMVRWANSHSNTILSPNFNKSSNLIAQLKFILCSGFCALWR